MGVVISIIGLGIIVGYFLRKNEKLFIVNDKMTMYAIYLLLFLLGVSVGGSEEITSNLDKIGIRVVIITLGATIGSVLSAWILYKLMFRSSNEK